MNQLTQIIKETWLIFLVFFLISTILNLLIHWYLQKKLLRETKNSTLLKELARRIKDKKIQLDQEGLLFSCDINDPYYLEFEEMEKNEEQEKENDE